MAVSELSGQLLGLLQLMLNLVLPRPDDVE